MLLGMGEMVRGVKSLATDSDKLLSSPISDSGKRELSAAAYSLTFTCMPRHMHSHTHMKK